MNKRQKLVQQQFLNDEKIVIQRLEQVYEKSLSDIEDKIKNLNFSINDLKLEYSWLDDGDPEKERIKSMIQSKIYQKQYQEQLRKQVDGIVQRMHVAEFTNISDYLDTCYTNAFLGTMFDAHGQGIPIISPIDQEAMVRAVQLESKISKGLYTRLGEDVGLLKKKITAQVSRSIATGLTYAQTAKALENYTRICYNNAIRIARTEGHRVQTTATMDAMETAKERGADVLKQWDSTLDDRTRESHVAVDGQIRELNKPFSNGLMYPGDPNGRAEEVINCRCALLQRARWALTEDESFTKFNGFTKQVESFDSPESYGEFKEAFFSKENESYMGYVNQMEDKYGTKDFPTLLNAMSDREYNHYSKLLGKNPVYNKANVSGNVLTNAGNSGKISRDIVAGAYNNKNDPEGIMRKIHAEKYYASMRNSDKDTLVSTIANNTGVDVESVSKMYDHLFINQYDLGKGYSTFDEDYDIAESLRRLRDGKNIQEHDLLLVKHEALEYDLMNKDGLLYEEAHAMANKSFDYQSALERWLDENEG